MLKFSLFILIASTCLKSGASLLSANSIDGNLIVVTPGGTFSVNITSQTPPTTGLAYVMLASKSGIFTLIGRDVSGSPFSVLDVPDGDTETQLGVLGASAGLDPTNGSDLGADVIGDNSVTGTQHVAKLTFRVATDATPGVYTIQPWDDLIDGGWYGPGPGFERSVFDDFTNQIVTVASTPTPEPQGVALGLASLVPLLLRRGNRRKSYLTRLDNRSIPQVAADHRGHRSFRFRWSGGSSRTSPDTCKSARSFGLPSYHAEEALCS